MFREWGSMSLWAVNSRSSPTDSVLFMTILWKGLTQTSDGFIITSNLCLKVWSQTDIMPFNPHLHLGLSLRALLFTDPLCRRAELLSVSAAIWTSIPRQHLHRIPSAFDDRLSQLSLYELIISYAYYTLRTNSCECHYMLTSTGFSAAIYQAPLFPNACNFLKCFFSGERLNIWSALQKKKLCFHPSCVCVPADDTLDFSKPSGATRQHGAGVCKAITDDWEERADSGVCTLSVKFLLPLR